MKMGNPHSRQLFLCIYLILYGLSSLQLACAALGDGTTPTLESTLVSVTYNVDRYVDTPAQDAYDYHFDGAKLLDKSMGPPKSGTFGYLFEIRLNCSSNPVNITLHPDDNTANSIPRMAFITSSSCYMNGLAQAVKLGVKGAIVVVNDPDQPPALPENDTFGFPVFVLSAQDASSQTTLLNRYDQPLLGNNTATRLKVIMSYSSNFFPGVWEFTLIVVVVLLAVSFATSVAMHCHLYRIRRRQQRRRLSQRGTAGQLGMKTLTLDTEMLAKFPIRTYKTSSIPPHLDANSEQSDDGTKDNSSGKQEIHSESNKYAPVDLEANASTVDLSSNPTSTNDKSPSLGRNTSINSTHSKKSVHSRKEGMHSRQVSIRSVRSTKSTRSANAIASATALAAGASDNNTVEDHSYNNTCAVCLEDFDEGDQLRTLTCGHEYHAECIDPWLTQKSSLCPLCKYDCVPKIEHEEGPEAPSNENVYVDAFLTWWPVVRGRNALQRIRRRPNNTQDAQLESNNNENTNESSTPLASTLASVEVQQANASTPTLSRTQTNSSSHSVLQSSVSPSSNTPNETILREIAIAGHIG